MKYSLRRTAIVTTSVLVMFACAQAEGGDTGGTGGGSSLPSSGGTSAAAGGMQVVTSPSGGTTAAGGTGAVTGGASSAGGSVAMGGEMSSSGGTTGVDPDVIANADVVVNANMTGNNFVFTFTNQSETAVPSTGLELRYWYTADADVSGVSYYQGGNWGSATWTNGESEGEKFLAATFTGSGVPAAASQNDVNASEVQLQLNNGSHDAASDYSYSGGTGPNDKVTLYLDGTLIWGCEPGGTCAGDGMGGAMGM